MLRSVTNYGLEMAPAGIACGGGRQQTTIDARRYDGVLFDLDGVVTDTASVHARTWTHLFNEFFHERVPGPGEDYSPFTDSDYRRYVDGRSRLDGIRAFLSSRGIRLAADEDTVCNLADRKQGLFEESLRNGVTAFDSAVALVHRLREAHIATAVYSSSMNCHRVLQAAGLDGLFEIQVDGQVAKASGLKGKPDPALLREAANRLGVRPERCVVIEDAQAGVIAGRSGGFGLVIGIASIANSDGLLACGADVVVDDLAEVTVVAASRRASLLPNALASVEMLGSVVTTRQPMVFVDIDGTLSDIADDPAAAGLLSTGRDALRALVAVCPVAILSGRNLLDVRARIDLPGLWYAGNHGIEILAPDGARHDNDDALAARPSLRRAADALSDALSGIGDVVVERNEYAVAVHHDRVASDQIGAMTAAVHTVGRRERLRITHGRGVIELQPDIEWDNGAALLRIAGELGIADGVPVYIGDGLNEDGFDVVARDGVGVLVRRAYDRDRATAARFAVDSPQQVTALLTEIAARIGAQDRHPTDAWAVTFADYVPEAEAQREVLCGIGNGYLSSRGSAPESRVDAVHYPGTYCAGIYNRLSDHLVGSTVENESIVNLPNWLPFTFCVDDGPWFDLDDATYRILAYRQTIDIQRAELLREFRFSDSEGRITSVTQRRFVSMHEPHLCGLQTTLSAENWSGTLRFRSTIDGDVTNNGVKRYRDLSGKHLGPPVFSAVGDSGVLCETQTVQSHIRIAVAARSIVWTELPAAVNQQFFDMGAEAGHIGSVSVTSGQSVTVEKMAVVYTGRDTAISEPGEAARKALSRLDRYAAHHRDHLSTWSHLWEGFHVNLDDNEDALRVVRLHISHLLQCVSPHTADRDVGIPARGLHGEGYRGHIFWDDLFVLPVLNLRLPNITRSVLQYRYRRLNEACHAAAAAGYSGAMFPWQSGSDGREESQQQHLNPQSGRWNPDPSALAHHVGIAIAYTAWQYYQVTHDLDFLTRTGAEVLIQIARFWVSRARFDPVRDRYVIDGVIGPDEFHTGYPGQAHRGIDNNAYTNIMAVWVILRARDALDALPLPDRLDLVESLHLHGAELALWDRVTRRMFVPFHDGVISQFEGYENLRELNWAGYRQRYSDIGRMDRILEAEGDDVNNYRVAKQADTVMLFYLLSADELREVLGRLGYPFGPEQVPKTIDYYLNRTTHGSTLSAVVYSWVLARGDRAQAADFFRQVLASDVADVQGGTTAEGIHLAAMAGSIDLLQRCYAGLETRNDRLVLGPMWPESSGPLGFSIHYRGHRLHLRITGRTARVVADPSDAPPIAVECRGTTQVLHAGETVTVR